MFIMVDGIDGSGKTTIIRQILASMEEKGQAVFRLADWCKKHHTLPQPADFAHADVLATCEPTHAWVGDALRQEMIRHDTHTYHPKEIASAFALDRLILYRRCLLPAKHAGKTIIADRGVTTSIVYQPATDPDMRVEDLLQIHGNALAMEHAPDHLIITTVDPNIALERLGGRSDKKDDAIFEQKELMHTFTERYQSNWFRELFTSRGTHIHYLDTSGTIDEVQKKIPSLISSLS